VNDGPAEDGVRALLLARALWILRNDAAPTAIDGATRALVEGWDSAPLRELAGAAPDINVFELGDLLGAALGAAGIDVQKLTDDDALHLVARQYAESVLRGDMRAREFAGWAHTSIGHEGPAWAQDLVELDDQYDGFEGGWGEEPDWAQTLNRYLIVSQLFMDKWDWRAR
jgi:hypothetical protein